MTEPTAISWSELVRFRAEGGKRFGAIHDIPIVDLRTVLRTMADGTTRVLDVGAGASKPLLRILQGVEVEYRSLDTDPAGDFDFHDVGDIPADLRFELAVANQILEHVTPGTALEIVRGVAGVLAPGGRLAATVPNAQHPVRHWGDATHVTAWPYLDLYGLFRLAGLEVERVARYTKRRLTRRPIRRMIVKTVAREYRVDWCDSILVVGRRPAGR